MRYLKYLCRMILFICCISAGAMICYADTVFLDASDDAIAYRQAVAEMNVRISPEESLHTSNSRRADTGATVLCKTDGTKLTPDMAEEAGFSLQILLAGPNARYTMRFDSHEAAEDAVSWLEEQPWIRYAEFDHMISAAQTDFVSWGANSMGVDDYLSFANGWGEGSSLVAVIDSGVSPHDIFTGKLVNGGYDYVDNDEDPTNDEFGHGTRVAGIVADCSQTAPVSIFPIRVLNSQGNGSISNVVNAIEEACDGGADVINLSMAVRGKYVALEDMILEAVARGVVVVVAAGNFSCDTSKICPASLSDAGVIVVSSAERSGVTDILADYSCYGSSVDVSAYGSNILCCDTSGGYSTYSGTSMAAPHISAVCALMHLLEPELSPADIENRLKTAADHSEGLALKLLPLVPVEECFSMWHIRLAEGETLQLPVNALPVTCKEKIKWSISGESLQLSEDGVLEAVSPGTGILSSVCRGFEDCSVIVEVIEEEGAVIRIPYGVTAIEKEAFAGSGVVRVELPETVRNVGDGAFAECPGLRIIKVQGIDTDISEELLYKDRTGLLICPLDSLAYNYAKAANQQYLVLCETID